MIDHDLQIDSSADTQPTVPNAIIAVYYEVDKLEE